MGKKGRALKGLRISECYWSTSASQLESAPLSIATVGSGAVLGSVPL